MKALLASLLLALPIGAQDRSTFNPFVMPGHSPNGVWSQCCGGTLLPNPWLVQVPGYPARAGGTWGLRPATDVWPACTTLTTWHATYYFGAYIHRPPITFATPDCSTGARLASMSTDPAMFFHIVAPVQQRAAGTVPGGSLVTYLRLPELASMKSSVLYVQAIITKMDTIPSLGFFEQAGRINTWVASVVVE